MTVVAALQMMDLTAGDKKLPDDLIYVEESDNGIARKRKKDEFVYLDADGRLLKCENELARVEALGLPPAWRDVWICPQANGHLQATGVDDAGRKQYRYHDDWRAFREQTKFNRLIEFGAALPRIRRRVRRTFREVSDPDKELVISALVRLLDNAPLRIGSSTGEGDVVGACTLEQRNVKMTEDALRLDYTAKGGKRVRRQISDRRLLQILEKIDELPGKELFRYIGSDGDIYGVRSEHVNDWLQDVADSEHITAKTFRTWAGTLAAFELCVSDEKPTIKAMSEEAASVLRNTPTIARSSYIHPAVISLREASFDKRQAAGKTAQSAPDLTKMETAMLGYLAEAQGLDLAP